MIVKILLKSSVVNKCIYIYIYIYIYVFHVFHNLQANEWCYYKHSYIKSNSFLLTYQGIAVNTLFYNCVIKIY